MKNLLTTLILATFTLLLPFSSAFAQVSIGNTGQADGINIGNIRLPNPDPRGTTREEADYTISLHNQPTETGRLQLQVFTFANNFSDTITTADYTISLVGEKGKNYLEYTANRTKNNYYCDSPHNPQIFTSSFPLTTIFNSEQTFKNKIKVQYAECKNKEPLTAYFTNTEVQYGSTTWNLTLHTTERATIDQQQLQYWTHKFNIHQIVNSGDNMIIITMTPRLQERLEDIECTAYNLTIPRNALTSIETQAKNTTDIIGEFRITNCPPKTTSTDEDNENGRNAEDGTSTTGTSITGTGTTNTNTMKQGNLYLSILDTDENGKQYINISNLVYLLGIISFFLILFFVLFGFIKNSFLGRSKKY